MARFSIIYFYLCFAAALCVVGLAALVLRRRPAGRKLASLFLMMLTFALLEGASAGVVHHVKGRWPWKLWNQNSLLFFRHPYLIGMGKPNVSERVFKTRVTQNEYGFRGGPIAPKSSRIRVIALGGSTTYGVYVNDDQTWPALLQQQLGEKYEVLNFGIPAQSTVEHIILAAFYLPEFHPDIVLIHAGLNDLHVSNTPELKPDYSNAHAPMAVGNLGLCPDVNLPPLALLRVVWLGLERLGLYPRCEYEQRPQVKPSAGIDERALSLFHRNLDTLIDLCRRLGAKVVLLPQVLLAEKVTDGSYQWWTPNISPEALPETMRRYNAELAQAASGSGAQYVSGIDAFQWNVSDFADSSHLNAAGNQKFAAIVAAALEGQSR